MKKLLLCLSVLSLMSVSSYAAETLSASAELPIMGSVDRMVKISFENSFVGGLDLKSQAPQSLGKVHFESNSPMGYEIRFSSNADSRMQRTGNSSDKIEYTVRADGQVVVSKGIRVDLESGVASFTSDANEVVKAYKELTFESSGLMDLPGADASQLIAGNYSDTIRARIIAH